MKLLIIDGQGGKIGSQLTRAVKDSFPDIEITAVGTNSIATTTMLKAGADIAATGENPVIVACRTADIIAGPLGIVIADSLFGEITPTMAVAIGGSTAQRILIPVTKCKSTVAGMSNLPLSALIEDAVHKIAEIRNQA